MSTQFHRKCCKCGVTAAQDKTVPFFRFPKPGKENVLKAKAWAIYCWPDKNWDDVETLVLLNKQSKVLCGRHFEDSCFLDSSNKKISRFAVPGTTEYVVKIMNSLRSQAKLEVAKPSTMKENQRQCIKCGRSPSLDRNVKLYRFPRPGTRNLIRSESWAKFCFPDKEWSSLEFQRKLFTEHRMLCDRHFKVSSFIDFSRKMLDRSAIPENVKVYPSQDDPEPGQHQQIIGISSEQSRSTVEHIPTDPIYLGDETVELDSDEQGPEVPAVITASEVTLKQATDVPFSWEQDSAVVPTDDADICSAPIDESFIAGDDTDSYKEEIQISTEDHGAYTCNICSTEIKDFRYTCVQCPDFDLCGACEARQAHATHYVLRIPGPRPQGEVSAMLRTIRRALLSDAIVHVGDGQQVDFEIKEEEDLEDPINVELTQDNTTKSDPSESLDGTIEAEQNSEQELQFEQMENKNYNDNSERNAESQNRLVVAVGQKRTKSTEPSTIVLPTSAKIAITEPGRLTSTLYTTDQVRLQILPMNLPKIDKDVKKRELMERLQGKRSKILEKRDDVPRNLEQRKSVPIILGQSSIETRILQQKSAPRKIMLPISATRKMSQPIILKRRDLRKPDSNSPIEQNFSKASEEIESISESSLNKRSIDQSIAVEYSKKMKVKEISLPPVPEDVMRQLEAKARVCLHKLRSADPQTQTALHTHDKKHSDSK